MKRKLLFFLLSFCFLASFAEAQVTTSSMSGKITSENKEPVIGATIVAIHEPSGTSYGAVTNVDGRFTIQGMRTGGPYNVVVSYVGYQKSTYKNIRLELGNNYQLNVSMHKRKQTAIHIRRYQFRQLD